MVVRAVHTANGVVFKECVKQFSIIKPAWVLEDFPLVKAIHLNACGQSRRKFSHYAHAHNHERDTHRGHICINEYAWDAEQPTDTFLHEYAHLLAPNCRHGKPWVKAYERLCQQYGKTPYYGWKVNDH